MGHATTGLIGASIATRRRSVAVVGDGAMLMNSEVSTAAQYQLPVIWVVMNDSRYNMVEQGARNLVSIDYASGLPSTDFAAIARAMAPIAPTGTRKDSLDAQTQSRLRVLPSND